MIKVNWADVEAVKNQLLRDHGNDSMELMLIVFYHGKSACDKVQLILGQLEVVLFEVSASKKVRGVFLYDVTMKRPYYKCEEQERVSVTESIDGCGHSHIVSEFNKMRGEERDMWLDIAFAQMSHDVNRDNQ